MSRNVKASAMFLGLMLSLPVVSEANSFMCPYRDKFTIFAPAQTRILNAIAQGNVYYTQLSDTYFELSCADSSNLSGDLLIKIGFDYDNQCSLTIHDGPFEMNPSVTSVYCNGAKRLSYLGMDHNYGTYDYTLKFIVL